MNLRAFVVLAILAPFSGCSKGEQEVARTPPSASLVAACEQMSNALCDRAASCAPFLAQNAYGDAASCTSFGRRFCGRWLTLAGVTRDEFVLKACAAAWSTADCDGFPSLPPPECDIRGSLVDGTSCGDGGQCESGFCTGGDGGCGVCAARAREGEGCARIDQCDRGLTCLGGLCFRAGAQGADCAIMGYDGCKPSLHCAKYTCAAPLAEGAACKTTSVEVQCDLRKGQQCLGGKCTTAALPAVGEACKDLCAFGAYCDGQVCRVTKGAGSACSQSAECQLGLDCEAGTCQQGPHACEP